MASVLGYKELEKRIKNGELFEGGVSNRVTQDDVTKKPILSYGVSLAGYDIRLGRQFVHTNAVESKFVAINKLFPERGENDNTVYLLFSNKNCNNLIDPKNLYNKDKNNWHYVDAPCNVILGPFCTVLGLSKELITMPNDYVGICIGKSTYARSGILINVTPLEPGWKGYLVIEITNLTNSHTILYPDEGIAQIIFLPVDNTISYFGNWQNQPDLRHYFQNCPK